MKLSKNVLRDLIAWTVLLCVAYSSFTGKVHEIDIRMYIQVSISWWVSATVGPSSV